MRLPPHIPERLYLDHAATTPVRPEVRRAMLPYLTETFGNASTAYAEGRAAREALERAREEIREVAAADGFDFVFMGSGTEADNSAVLGTLLGHLEDTAGRPRPRFHLVTSAIEHPAVLETCSLVRSLGGEVTTVPPGADGKVEPARVEAALCNDTRLVSIMAVNNETGVVQDVAAIAALTRARGILFHTDAVQAWGKLRVDLRQLPIDLVTLSGHKIYGPKGAAGLFVRRGIRWRPLLRGGSQEGGRRAGTENVAAALGLATALRLAEAERPDVMERLGAVRDRLREELMGRFADVRVNGSPDETVPTLLNVSFPTVDGESLVRLLDSLGVAVSTGSACNVGARKRSHVLEAMGLTARQIRGSIRFSLGRDNSQADLEPLFLRLTEAVARLERLAPMS